LSGRHQWTSGGIRRQQRGGRPLRVTVPERQKRKVPPASVCARRRNFFRDAAAFYRNRDAYDVARVISATDDGRAVAVVADISNAHNNRRFSTLGNAPKVNRVYRCLVYVRPLDMLGA
jgi:hypothetical protein